MSLLQIINTNITFIFIFLYQQYLDINDIINIWILSFLQPKFKTGYINNSIINIFFYICYFS